MRIAALRFALTCVSFSLCLPTGVQGTTPPPPPPPDPARVAQAQAIVSGWDMELCTKLANKEVAGAISSFMLDDELDRLQIEQNEPFDYVLGKMLAGPVDSLLISLVPIAEGNAVWGLTYAPPEYVSAVANFYSTPANQRFVPTAYCQISYGEMLRAFDQQIRPMISTLVAGYLRNYEQSKG